MASDVRAGQEIEIQYPFVRDLRQDFDLITGKEVEVRYWRPGHTYTGGFDGGAHAVCDAYGSVKFKVVGVFSPSPFPSRVFFQREFCSPSGVWFGNKKLHIATIGKFRRLTRGYAIKCDLSGLKVAA